MFLKYFYDPHFAHASYMVGCQKTGTAIVIDPGRSISEYIDAARREGLNITMAIETHIHADFVSGLREFGHQTGAQLLVSDEGPQEWKYEFVKNYTHRKLKHGELFNVGNIEFNVMHTPGHTPESISLLLTDKGGGADEPMGIFTGDFVFVGAIGRPDLLEKVAGQDNTAEAGARDLYTSLQHFKQLPEYCQVWPAHGAGSACGKGLGAVPSTTVGYEKRFSAALQYSNENEFVGYVLDEQPPAPGYFALMKKINKDGPALLSELTSVPVLDASALAEAKQTGILVDLTNTRDFQHSHIQDSINIPLGMLASWAGWLLDYTRPVYLIGTLDNAGQEQQALQILRKMGVDNIAGIFDRSLLLSNTDSNSYAAASPQEAAQLIESGEAVIVDVRGEDERQSTGFIEESLPIFLGQLPHAAGSLPKDKIIITQCASGIRSAVAASIILRTGRQVLNLEGGFQAWSKAGQ